MSVGNAFMLTLHKSSYLVCKCFKFSIIWSTDSLANFTKENELSACFSKNSVLILDSASAPKTKASVVLWTLALNSILAFSMKFFCNSCKAAFTFSSSNKNLSEYLHELTSLLVSTVRLAIIAFCISTCIFLYKS